MADDKPVITYQDNLQMKRTSMRHLRLSKLQKEKMWDFTVIDGIEELFKVKDTGVTSQQDVIRLNTKTQRLVSISEAMKTNANKNQK